jgi:hypothetical protein
MHTRMLIITRVALPPPLEKCRRPKATVEPRLPANFSEQPFSYSCWNAFSNRPEGGPPDCYSGWIEGRWLCCSLHGSFCVGVVMRL